MTKRRQVRVAPSFFDRLDELLPEERTATGKPSATDFLLHEIPTIIDRLAEEYERHTMVLTAAPEFRVMIAADPDPTLLDLHLAGRRWSGRDRLPRAQLRVGAANIGGRPVATTVAPITTAESWGFMESLPPQDRVGTPVMRLTGRPSDRSVP